MSCAERADRVREGLETDLYRCTVCGYELLLDFDQFGPPKAPLWPITPEQRAAILKDAPSWQKKTR